MCAVDQKRPFFPRAGPFLDLPPLRGLSPSLTGPPYGKAPYGEALREGWALTGNPLRGGTVLTGRAGVLYGPSQRRTTKRLTGGQGPYGKPLTRRDGPYEKGRSLMEGPGSLTGPSQRRTTKRLTGRAPFPLTGALTGRPPYRKAPYGEASYGRAPYGATGRDFTRIGREFPFVCRRPKKVVFS